MPLRFTLRQLEYFVAVGEAGSIAKAAEQVNVSPPSISASIAQLEAEFGVQLFVRKHSHALALTAGGRLFLKEAARLLNDADALHDIAGDIAEKVRGPLAIGCLLTFAQIVLPALRRKFEDAYPDVRVRQFERNQGQLFEMLQRGEIDAALTYDLELSQDMTFEPLMQLPAYVMLPAAHHLAAKAGITPEELVDEPMVLLDLPYSREYFLSAFQPKGLLERGPIPMGPGPDASGPVPFTPRPGAGMGQDYSRALPPARSNPMGGFAANPINELVPVKHPVTGKIEYVPKWTVQAPGLLPDR